MSFFSRGSVYVRDGCRRLCKYDFRRKGQSVDLLRRLFCVHGEYRMIGLACLFLSLRSPDASSSLVGRTLHAAREVFDFIVCKVR
jgi:hypothetical protein